MKITISEEEWEAIGKKGPGVRMYRGLRTYFYNGEELWNTALDKPLVHTDAEWQSWQQLIILPGVEEIPDHTFTGCENVEIVFMHDSTKRMGKKCFYGLTKLSFVQLSRHLEYIGAYALSCCALIWSLFIPSTCRQICKNAFEGCDMLIILSVHENTELGNKVIKGTALLAASPFAEMTRSDTYDDYQVNKWIKNRHDNFRIHEICCSETPRFSKDSIVPNKYNCHEQDDSGLTALHYLVINPFADFETIKNMAHIGGPALLKTEDTTWNVLQYACLMNDIPLQRLFVKIGGQDLADTLRMPVATPSGKWSVVWKCFESSRHFKNCESSQYIEYAVLLHDYIEAIISHSERNIHELMRQLLESRPPCKEIYDLINDRADVPKGHVETFEKYIQDSEEIEILMEREKMVPLNRSTITFVGEGHSGKTSTINSLKGYGFQPHCPSTKGSRTSEVDIRDFGICVSSIDANNSFRQKERDAKSTERSMCTHLDKINTDYEQQHRDEESKVLVENILNRGPVPKLRSIASGENSRQNICHKSSSLLKNERTGSIGDEDQQAESILESRDSAGNHDGGDHSDRESSNDKFDADDTNAIMTFITACPCLPLWCWESENILEDSLTLLDPLENQGLNRLRCFDPCDESLKDKNAKKAEVEENTVKKVDDMHLMNSKDGTSIRFTIFDNGGQTVFRGIQNLFFSREGIFIVVFDMMKILNENEATKQESLEHLQYWLSSIKLDACNDDSSADPLIKYPPVILVGTHYDDLLKTEVEDSTPSDNLEKLDEINKILHENLDISSLVPIPSTFTSSTSTTNETQDLSFWPVDNSNPQDISILKLRQLLLNTALTDKGFDVSQEVPISMLQTMDKLTEISKDHPIMSVNANENGDTSVMEVMSQCGVFDDESYDNAEREEVCNSLLKQYHNIGHFLYFHQVPALRDYCILDPQWLIDAIAYVVRDFRFHWFLQDEYAIALNDGISWNRLKNDGVVDVPLLRLLWQGYKEHFVFLQRLMLEIGIFGKCKDCFTVPILQTHPSKDSYQESKDILSDHDEKGNIEFEEHGFAITTFYCRLVNALVEGGCEPLLLESACLFRFQAENESYALLLDIIDMKIRVLFHPKCSKNSIHELLISIRNKCASLNETFYKRQLEISFNGISHELTEVFNRAVDYPGFTNAQDVFRDGSCTSPTFAIDYKEYACEEIKTELSALNFQDPRLSEIAALMQFHNKTIPALRNEYFYMCHEDDEMFQAVALLPELKLRDLEKKKITNLVKEQKKPPPAKKIMVACMENSEEEEKIIQHQLLQSNCGAFLVHALSAYFKTGDIYEDHETLQILHCAGHKEKLENTDICIVFKDENCKKQVECVVLNNCKSEKITNAAEEHFGNRFIVYWDSRVRDEAAIRFAEEFYRCLCSAAYRGVRVTFKEAFEKTKKSILKCIVGEEGLRLDQPNHPSDGNDSNLEGLRPDRPNHPGDDIDFFLEGFHLDFDNDSFAPGAKRQRRHDASLQSVSVMDIDSSSNPSRDSKNDITHKCHLKCSYSFACKREPIENNCQFIKYKNPVNPFLDEIIDVCKRDASKGPNALEACPKCFLKFCKSAKIPSDNGFISCYVAHEKQCKPDSKPHVDIEIPEKCKKYNLASARKGALDYCIPCKKEK
ncbi:hypothetical protein CTEN210_06591 [Chaetoceros tenuissimus]|uniref:Uncharacterized protein n=1 Tax=Chaetoceros tenuissimus TaxID=426638 RepID=A0AAD3CSM3_9STRA|nr:hypothetical protein CTEN210_06591 [Chaetoceros tenuissimus]